MVVKGQLYAPAASLSGKWAPGWGGGLQCQCGKLGKEKSLVPVPGLERQFLGLPTRSQTTIATELHKQQFQTEFMKLPLALLHRFLVMQNYVYYY